MERRRERAGKMKRASAWEFHPCESRMTVEKGNRLRATRHAEMEAIDVLMEQWQKEGLDITQVAQRFSACDLYVTCEPCIMCAAALSILG
ncbi:hypothetical protein KSP40_PGU014473 [Platanthera guangdongensis]|uniref:CMP/dCMP-type deaminase domain-containing protein n=1 Tax=Platanthera guangdongensis TaxID=2320717 RepID=A0ABR2MFH9_9ASPA